MGTIKANIQRWWRWLQQHEMVTVIGISAITSICLNALLLIVLGWLSR